MNSRSLCGFPLLLGRLFFPQKMSLWLRGCLGKWTSHINWWSSLRFIGRKHRVIRILPPVPKHEGFLLELTPSLEVLAFSRAKEHSIHALFGWEGAGVLRTILCPLPSWVLKRSLSAWAIPGKVAHLCFSLLC